MKRISNPSYPAMHLRVRNERGPASDSDCVDCGYQATDWSYRGGDPLEQTYIKVRNGKENEFTYSFDISYYDPRCRSCHISFDWAKKNLSDTDETYYVRGH